MQADVNNRINLQRSWSKRTASNGAEITATEKHRTRKSEGLLVVYELYTKGLPQDATYQLYVLPITASGPKDMMLSSDHLRIDNDGHLDYTLLIPDPAPAEPFRFALISNDRKSFATVSVQPMRSREKIMDVESK